MTILTSVRSTNKTKALWIRSLCHTKFTAGKLVPDLNTRLGEKVRVDTRAWNSLSDSVFSFLPKYKKKKSWDLTFELFSDFFAVFFFYFSSHFFYCQLHHSRSRKEDYALIKWRELPEQQPTPYMETLQSIYGENSNPVFCCLSMLVGWREIGGKFQHRFEHRNRADKRQNLSHFVKCLEQRNDVFQKNSGLGKTLSVANALACPISMFTALAVVVISLLYLRQRNMHTGKMLKHWGKIPMYNEWITRVRWQRKLTFNLGWKSFTCWI